MKTALQQAIENLQQNVNGLSLDLSETNKQSVRNIVAKQTLQQVIVDLQQLLPIEREQIEAAYSAGCTPRPIHPSDYFTQTFPQTI